MFSRGLSLETNSSVFSFYLTFSVSMKLGKNVTCGLEGASFCGSMPIQSVCAQCLRWESWIWREHKSCLSQGGLAAITLVGAGVGDEGTKSRTRCEPGLLLCSVAITTLWGGVGSQVAGTEALRGGSKLIPFPLSMCSPPSWHWHSCLRGRQCWSKRAWRGHLAWVWMWAVAVQVAVRDLESFWCAAYVRASNGRPHPTQRLFQVWATFMSHSRDFPLTMAVIASVWSCVV